MQNKSDNIPIPSTIFTMRNSIYT
uniref:Uncharacterized protein n=1 Tax=Anguilla anguilla TaxID=7936 RepID=A0A0E9TXP7_ANGAN